jgi:hypothetical protein
MSVSAHRRTNALILFREFVASRAAPGTDTLGLAKEFAASLEISASRWSQFRSETSPRNISDNLARQIERHRGKPSGWLDVQHEAEAAPDPGEERFIEMARAAYRSQNARGKRALRTLMLENTRPADGA